MFKLISRFFKKIYVRYFILPTIKRKIVTWAKSKLFIKQVYLYGSFIKGTTGKDSDLDIAVVHEKFSKDTDEFTTYFFEKDNWAEELKKILDFPRVHLEWAKSEHVGQFIAKKHILIYEKIR